ncbi:early endosome antigen 1 isoform X1 [Onthophagus taurus]|uniref:early endosome antigen 1 isoform X1 n=1 Tax=Onthophagus taurus TaxID=166361 RepID=UPI0039BE366C
MDESDKKEDNPETHGKSKQKREILLSDDSTSISLNSFDLPDNTKPQEAVSESSTISEHLDSLQSGIENDRSLSEISLKQDFIDNVNDYERINKSELSLSCNSDGNEAANNVQSILNEILKDKQFSSRSDGTKIEKSDSCSSRDVSLNIFEGVSLDDSSINNYVSKLKGFNPSDEGIKVKGSSRKNSELGNLSVEFDASSVTSATEYKCYQDDSSNKIVNYQDAISHRDRQIRHLEDILQQMCENRDELQKQSENFVSKIHQLEKQLKEHSTEIKQHQCVSDTEQWSPNRKVNLKSTHSTDSLVEIESSLDQERSEKVSGMGINKIFRKLEQVLSPHQLVILSELKNYFEFYVQKRIDVVQDEHKKEIKEIEVELKKELGDKHNQELEDLRTYYEKKCVELEKNYSEEINRKMLNDSSNQMAYDQHLGPGGDTKLELKHLQNNLTSQEVISNEFEIVDVVKSYERRLQEQIDLARIDIFKNLMQEIKKLSQYSDDTYWPRELLQIKRCFQEKYESEIENLKEKHDEEVKNLKDSFKENEKEGEVSIDRDGLKKSNVILKNIINELLKYFTKCEDELNKTLIDEILKQGFENNQLDQNETLDNSSITESFIKRVHFTPNLNFIDSSIDSVDFKNELGTCLDRLKSDANTILALSSNINQKPHKNDDFLLESNQLKEAKEYIKTLESERNHLENQIEHFMVKQKTLEKDLENSNRKITELIECGRNEIVSEGYGESSLDGKPGKIGNLIELQEKARNLAAEWKSGADHPLLELIEELCREGERIDDESKKEKRDLIQQIEAAEKKLRSTNRFLEEQAMEREQERSDAQKEIESLNEILKEKEKEKQNRNLMVKEDGIWKLNECCHNAINFVNSTVEHLERQMHEMTRLQELSQAKHQIIETERKEAIDKISDLRDIIRDLDNQVKEKTISENELKEIISKLNPVVKQQSETIDELYEQLENYKLGPDVEFFKGKIVALEKEAQQLRLNSELAGSEGVIKEIQVRLYELESSIDKKTRDLEGLHSSSTGCSTPSDEMSYRDQVRPNTPGAVFDECDVPLQQLARLKEKLIKHSRAEDAAVKRIRDLEMQLSSTKQELEDSQNEKDLLQAQVTEQIVLLSSLQMRLDEQRLKAEQNQKQANTSLELKIYDLENEIQELKDTMHAKDKNLKQLNKVIDETKKRLEDREKELNNREDDEILLNFEKEMIKLKEENRFLKTKIESDAQNAQILPGLVDNIIADKNSDIEKLRLKLDDTQKQLESFLSLNLDYDQLKHISRMKSSERGFSDFLNLTPIARRNENIIDSIENSMNFNPRNPNETKIDFNLVQNSTEIQHKKVHFDDEVKLETKIQELTENVLKLEENLKELKENFEIERKSLQLELAEKKMKLGEVENELKSSVDDHKRKDEMYFNLAKEKRDFEIKINEINRVFEEKNGVIKQLEEKIRKMNENLIEIDQIKADLHLKENELIQINTNNESKNKEIEKLLKEIKCFEGKMNENEVEMRKLNDLIVDKNCEIEILNEDILRYQNDLQDLKGQEEISEKNIEIIKLKSIQDDLKKEIIHLQEYLQEKDNIIEQMQKDTVSLHTNLETIQSKIQETGNIVDLRKRLQEEKHLNAILKEEIDSLKSSEKEEKCSSIEDIRGEVQKQLEVSAHLDLNLIQALSSEDEKDLRKNEINRLKIELEKSEVMLESERQNVVKLNTLLEKERFLLNSIQIEDSNLIEQLRIKFESVLDQKDELESILDQEKKIRFELENEVRKLKCDLSSSTTEYKKLPSLESQEIVKLKEEINLCNEKNENLQSEVRNLKRSKDELNSNLKYTKEMLGLKLKELENFEIKLQNYKIKEENLKEKLSEVKFELDRKCEETQNNRILLNQMEEERINLKKDQIILNERIRELEEDSKINDILNEEKNVNLNSPVPEKLLNKMRELTIEIKQQMEENKILTNNLTKIALERSKLLDKIRRLEQINTNLNYQNPQNHKSHQLFAKYLRAESYRKALIYQKHFLIKLLASYQKINTNVNVFQPKHPIKITEPIKKFKSCVIAIIAMKRMKFMVRRWHTGVRNYSSDERYHENGTKNDYEMKFEVGQPVSSQNFRRGESRSPQLMGSSWSGSSPPQKERPLSTQSDFAPLQTPLLLSEYVQRFDEMQKRLGLTFEKINN